MSYHSHQSLTSATYVSGNFTFLGPSVLKNWTKGDSSLLGATTSLKAFFSSLLFFPRLSSLDEALYSKVRVSPWARMNIVLPVGSPLWCRAPVSAWIHHEQFHRLASSGKGVWATPTRNWTLALSIVTWMHMHNFIIFICHSLQQHSSACCQCHPSL